MTGFGSFDTSTCERVLDLLEPGDLRLGQVVIKRVAVVSEELLILASCLLRPISRNSVLEEFSVRRFAVIQDDCSTYYSAPTKIMLPYCCCLV